MENFDLRKYLVEGRLFKEEYNFENSDYNSMSEKKIIEDILAYFKYERDERPEDMGDPDWWGGNPPFEGMSDDEIRTIIKSIISSKDFKDPEIQKNYDTPLDLAWEIYTDEKETTEEPEKNNKIDPQEKIQQHIKDGGKGDLILNNTSITTLPDNLKVGGVLNLAGSSITSLPKNLKVGDYLNLINTPIADKYSREEIRQMVPGVEGYIIV